MMNSETPCQESNSKWMVIRVAWQFPTPPPIKKEKEKKSRANVTSIPQNTSHRICLLLPPLFFLPKTSSPIKSCQFLSAMPRTLRIKSQLQRGWVMDSKKNSDQFWSTGLGLFPDHSLQEAHFVCHRSSLFTGTTSWLTENYCHLLQTEHCSAFLFHVTFITDCPHIGDTSLVYITVQVCR